MGIYICHGKQLKKMKEIHKNLFIGGDKDFTEEILDQNFSVIHCAKDPYWTNLYKMEGEQEINIAHRKHELFLNMVDSKEAKYFNIFMFEYSFMYIDRELQRGRKILLHCNKGFSRSPSVLMAFLVRNKLIKAENYTEAKQEFLKLYPEYQPNTGVEAFIIQYFTKLKNK